MVVFAWEVNEAVRALWKSLSKYHMFSQNSVQELIMKSSIQERCGQVLGQYERGISRDYSETWIELALMCPPYNTQCTDLYQ